MNLEHHPPLISATPIYGYLELHSGPGGERVPIDRLPFAIGRAAGNDYQLAVPAVSKHHAVIVWSRGACAIRDLGSTNGTFVNGSRIDERTLADGDLIHLGPVELGFRMVAESPAVHPAGPDPADLTQALPSGTAPEVIRARQWFTELIEREAVDVVYQPIVSMASRDVVAFEALARGSHPELPRNPEALFELAAGCGLAVELSRLCRRIALARSDRLPPSRRLFLNVHPLELGDPGFIASIEAAHRDAGGRPLVVEIAEAGVVDLRDMARFRRAFDRIGVEFAYDDFGAGQSRLRELSDCPPHFLKIDRTIVGGIETQPARQALVRALISAVEALGVQVLAEGVETEDTAATCHELGCQLGQGFLFGRPG